MKGPIKAAVFGVIRGVGGVAKDILVFNRSEDLDLRWTNGWGGGAAKAGMKGGNGGGPWGCVWGGGWCRQLHWGVSDSVVPLFVFPFPPDPGKRRKVDKWRLYFIFEGR